MRGTLPTKPGAKNNALYSNSTLAIDPDTGKVKWYHQHLENDTWDLDYVYERMLIDLPVNGETRKAVVTTGKLGIIEALDRTNGQWLWHKETVPQNVVASIDPKTGEKTINPASIPHIGQTTVNCPADPGGRGWPATAYNPKTGTLVPAAQRVLLEHHADAARSRPGLYRRRPRHLCARRRCPTATAISAASTPSSWPTARPSGPYRQRAPETGAVLPTAGGVVFAGAWDRCVPRLRRHDRQGAVADPHSTTRSTRSRSATASTASNTSPWRPATARATSQVARDADAGDPGTRTAVRCCGCSRCRTERAHRSRLAAGRPGGGSAPIEPFLMQRQAMTDASQEHGIRARRGVRDVGRRLRRGASMIAAAAGRLPAPTRPRRWRRRRSSPTSGSTASARTARRCTIASTSAIPICRSRERSARRSRRRCCCSPRST